MNAIITATSAPVHNDYTAAVARVDIKLQRTIDDIKDKVGPVVDCLVSNEHPAGCTREQLWDWSTLWCQARFHFFFIRLLAESSLGTWLTAVRQWAKFCDTMYHGLRDKYRVTAPKVAEFIDYWTSKPRARDLVNPFRTLTGYIGTGLTHLMFLQEAVVKSLQELKGADLQQLTQAREVTAKLHTVVKRASKELAIG
jgi:hypothetical protein